MAGSDVAFFAGAWAGVLIGVRVAGITLDLPTLTGAGLAAGAAFFDSAVVGSFGAVCFSLLPKRPSIRPSALRLINGMNACFLGSEVFLTAFFAGFAAGFFTAFAGAAGFFAAGFAFAAGLRAATVFFVAALFLTRRVVAALIAGFDAFVLF